MFGKIVRCAVIGGLILFVWSIIAWAIKPWQQDQYSKFKREKEVREVIKDNAPTSGLYILPNVSGYDHNSKEMEAAKEKMRTGPYIVAMVDLEGRNPNMLGSLMASLVLKIVAAGLVAWLLLQTPAREYKKSVLFVTVAGLVIAIMSALPLTIWFAFPSTITVRCMFEIIFGWFFAGIAMAKLIK